MFVTCSCQHCKGGIEFDQDYAGLEIECPHCACVTMLFLPTTPLPRPVVYPPSNPPVVSVGYDVLPGSWEDHPMTDKQKAMFVLYGLVIKDGLTKGQASKLIETAKQSGLRPTDENQKQADKLFETIGRQEAKDKLKELSKQVADGIKAIQNKKATIEEMEELKERLEEVFQELSGIIDNRIDEIDQAECDKANEEDD